LSIETDGSELLGLFKLLFLMIFIDLRRPPIRKTDAGDVDMLPEEVEKAKARIEEFIPKFYYDELLSILK